MKDSEKDFLKELNSAQYEAVTHINGPTLIIAGAGSGKTKVLTCRIANILKEGTRPSSILALTFTKKAANEMKERIASLVGEESARWIWMGTFHSIFVRFLRKNAQLLGYPEQFTIYDQSDSKSAIRLCIKELSLDEKVYKPNEVQSRISIAKNNLITATAYLNDQRIIQNDLAARKGRICDIYSLYAQKCKTAGAMDFDDLLINTNILFRDHPEVLAELQEKFQYLLVDEYQDTNYAQYLILKKLSAKHHNICVVGDDSQSIYGFRGARIENILNFRKDYPDAKEFKLEQNYRSTQTIVNAANSLIAKNENRLKKECFSTADEGEKIAVIKAFTEQEEAYLIASSIIEKIYADKAPYDNFVILYRTNAQSRALEEALRKKNLPYRVYAGHSFYDRAEVKDMLAYFRLMVNPKDDEAFRRVINVPARGIGETSMGYLVQAANKEGCSLYDALFLSDEVLCQDGLKDAALKKMRGFAAIITSENERINSTDAYQMAVSIGNASGYLANLKNDTSFEGQARAENVEELFNSVKDYVDEQTELRTEMVEDGYEPDLTITMNEYLENIALLSEVEKEDDENGEDASNKITLMTIHASKGLEYNYVYIAGMEENLFPSEGNTGKIENIEEERRLFYVAITRARKCVTLSFANNRMRWGQRVSNAVSRFLREINPAYLDGEIDEVDTPFNEFGRNSGFGGASFGNSSRGGYTSHSKNEYLTSRNSGGYHQKANSEVSKPQFSTGAAHTPSSDFKASPIASLAVGQRIEHDRFGFGTIISFDGENANKKAIVDFDEGGRKTLLLKYAKMQIVAQDL